MILLLSPLCPEGYRLCLLPSQLKVQPRVFLVYGPSLITQSSYTGFTHYSLVSPLINSETLATPFLHPQCTRSQQLQPVTKIFTCLGHWSASLRVLLFHYFVSQLITWKEIFQAKNPEAYFTVLLCNHKETWKQIYYLELFLRKFSGHEVNILWENSTFCSSTAILYQKSPWQSLIRQIPCQLKYTPTDHLWRHYYPFLRKYSPKFKLSLRIFSFPNLN